MGFYRQTLKPAFKEIAVIVPPGNRAPSFNQTTVLAPSLIAWRNCNVWLAKGRPHRPFRQNWKRAEA